MGREARRIGTTDVRVTTLGLGAATLGNLYGAISDQTAQAVVDTAIDVGVGYVDTAPSYGFGLSEKRVGRVLAGMVAPPIVSTKVGRRLVAAPDADVTALRGGFVSAEPFQAVFDYTHEGVRHAFSDSQARLGLERVDILYAHDLGALVHGEAHACRMREFLDGGYRAMRDLRDQGLVGAIGLGVNEWEVCEEVLGHVDLDCVLLAGRYTLLEQGALDSFLPLCAARQVSVVIGGPFNSGALVAPEGQGHYNYGQVPPDIAARIGRLRATAERHGVPLPAAALQFVLAHPAVVSVIPGLATPTQVRQAADWLDVHIPDDFWVDLKAQGAIDPSAPTPIPTTTRVVA